MTIETWEQLFDDRPAPWSVETFRNGGAAIIAAGRTRHTRLSVLMSVLNIA